MYQTVIFDLDGTLVDSHRGIYESVCHALTEMECPLPDDKILQKFIGPPLAESFMRYCDMNEEQSADAVKSYRVHYRAEGIYHFDVYPGIPEVLQELHEKGIKVILGTSKPEPFARIVTDTAGLTPLFDLIAGATFDETRKEKEQVLAYALEQLGHPDLSQCLMVGDRRHDVMGAKYVGLQTIGVLWGFGDEAELMDAGAFYLAQKPKDILSFVFHSV